VEHVSRIGDIKNTQGILIRRHEGKTPINCQKTHRDIRGV